jgi:cardiolipin synthase
MFAAPASEISWVHALTWSYLAIEWVIRVVMIPVVMRKRSPQAAMAWLLVIFFEPIFGGFVYLLIGETHLGRVRLKRRLAAVEMIRAMRPLRALDEAVAAAHVPEEQHDLARLAQKVGNMRTVGGNTIELLDDTEGFLDRLVGAIDDASHSAHLEYYIYSNDESGSRVSEALIRAAARGVRCRLLVDAAGSKVFLRSGAGELRHAGVRVSAALPVSLLRAMFSRIDLRNHRKIAVIDNRVAFTGSQNIINADYGSRFAGAWRDLSVRIEGPAAFQLQRVFLEDWAAERPDEQFDIDGAPLTPAMVGGVSIQSAPCGPGEGNTAFGDLLMACINEADHRLVMTTPYFVPDEPIMAALRVAALRGVEIDLVIPKKGNHPLVYAAARAYFDGLIAAGIRVRLHTNGLLHAKTLSVDDSFVLIGSGNFDIRSFTLNFELMQIFYGSEAVRELGLFHEHCFAESEPLDPEAWNRRGRVVRIRDNFAKLLSPLL